MDRPTFFRRNSQSIRINNQCGSARIGFFIFFALILAALILFSLWFESPLSLPDEEITVVETEEFVCMSLARRARENHAASGAVLPCPILNGAFPGIPNRPIEVPRAAMNAIRMRNWRKAAARCSRFQRTVRA